MRIGVVSDAVFPSRYPNGGHGLGQVAVILAEELRLRGHDVTLFAAPESAFSGALITPPDAHGYQGEMALVREVARMNRANPFDVVLDNSHIHRVSDTVSSIPTVNVYHDIYQPYQRCPVLLSHGQKAIMANEFQHAPVVHNALAPEHFPFGADPEDFVFWCGALSEIKNPLLAVEACAKAGVRLVMAGYTVYGKAFFGDMENVEYVGAVSPAQRNEYMRRARVFLQTGSVESFGLTTLEAGLCGTPVVALPYGGNVDTVLNRVNGVFAVTMGKDKAAAVAEAIQTAWWMDRTLCRQYIKATFSVEKQINAYEDLLASAMRGESWV